MKPAGPARPRVIPPPPPTRRNGVDQESPAPDNINPEIKQFLINTKKFLEDRDDQPLSPYLKKARADLYKFYASEQASNRDELPGEKSSENDGLEIYDDPTTSQDEPGIDTSVIEEEEYDLLGMEEIKEDDKIKGAEFAEFLAR